MQLASKVDESNRFQLGEIPKSVPEVEQLGVGLIRLAMAEVALVFVQETDKHD